ncbi:MAG: CBS domain-containing protein [Gammaproteobacteria bacterium]|nr:CBS domain-containing protein [Gammaproteobacteria bacterium]
MKRIPLIKSVMTAFPYYVDIDASIQVAITIMADHDIRHLPVKSGEELVGVVTDRDIKQASDSALGLPSEVDLRVKDVSVRETYVVDLNERLDNVLLNMAEKHIGCAIVVRDSRLVGIFTTVDACRVFGEHLRALFSTGSGNSAA